MAIKVVKSEKDIQKNLEIKNSKAKQRREARFCPECGWHFILKVSKRRYSYYGDDGKILGYDYLCLRGHEWQMRYDD